LVVAIGAAILIASDRVLVQSLPAPSIRDSSGVRIVEYSTIKTSVPAFRITATLAEVGGLRDEPREEFDARTGHESATRFSNGNIAVAEWSTVRVVDSSGRFVRTVGRKGGGPGEVSGQIVRVCRLPGDSLLVISNNRRISIFDASGKHVRTSSLRYEIAYSCGFGGSVLGIAPDTSVTAKNIAQDAALKARRVKLFSLTYDGKGEQFIGTFDAWMRPSVINDEFSAVQHGANIYADNGSRPEIKMYALNGKLKQIVRWRDSLAPVTPQLVEELTAGRFPRNTPATVRARIMTEFKPRAFLPAYLNFFADQTGRLWVKDYWPQYRGNRYAPGYTVFAPDGALLGRFVFPEDREGRLSVTDAGSNYVVIYHESRETGVSVSVQAIALAR